MPEESIFDRLVAELPLKERRELLDKVSSSVVLSEEPLATPLPDEERYDVERTYRRLGFFSKIILFIKSLFKHKDPLYVVEDTLIDRLAREVERGYPGIFSYRLLRFLPGFAEEIETLRDSLSIFSEPLRQALGTKKRDFVAFLGGLDMPDIQEKLLAASDPEVYFEEHGSDSEDARLKRDMELNLHDVLQDIPKDERQRVFKHARSAHYLNLLTFFPYGRILQKFRGSAQSSGCAAEEIKAPLQELTDILSGFHTPPALRLLEALFLFQLEDRMDHGDMDLAGEVSEYSRQAERCISQIRHFNKRIPLAKMLKVITRNINYQPKPLGGGEDWYHSFRQFWDNRLSDQIDEYLFEHESTALIEEAARLIGERDLGRLRYYRNGIWGNGTKVKFELASAFLQQFVGRVYNREMVSVLDVFLKEGAFYKAQNRKEFEDSLSATGALEDRLHDLDRSLAPEGDLGVAIGNIKMDSTPVADKEKKIVSILLDIDRDMNVILRGGIDNLLTLVNVVRGIIYGEVGGPYDTISNIGFIGGKENENLVMKLGVILKKTELAQRILGELYDLEVKRV